MRDLHAYWRGQSLLKLADHPREAVATLLELAAVLKAEKKAGRETPRLEGKNIALIFAKTSTRTRCAFEVSCHDQGAHPSYLASGSAQLGTKESLVDTARVLGRFYDAIEYRGFAQAEVEQLAQAAGVPVYNGLSDAWHPTQMLADLLTMSEHSPKSWREMRFAYLGDARNNMGHSLLVTGALMGMQVRIAAPPALQPHPEVQALAQTLARRSGAQILITEDPKAAVAGCDFIHTDIWVSMGEAAEAWQERIALLLPYRVDADLLRASGNPAVKFMHCLPACHDETTPAGAAFFQSHALRGIEVDHGVFESPAAIVFDQAENRLHTIKALLVATLAR